MMDVHKCASLILRDFTIIAKRHADLARDYRAIADTCRRLLDDTVPAVLKTAIKGKTVSSELLSPPEPELPGLGSEDPFGPDLDRSYD